MVNRRCHLRHPDQDIRRGRRELRSCAADDDRLSVAGGGVGAPMRCPPRPSARRFASPSEALRQARALDWMRAIRARHLSAETRGVGNNTSPGLQMPVGSNAHRTRLHRLEVVLAEHPRHVALLVHADAVFAGNGAARFDASMVRISDATFSACAACPGIASSAADERVQVAVAGVEDVADAQAGKYSRFEDAAKHFRLLRPRHDAVLHVVVRRHAAHRGERGFASLPDAIALRLITGDLDRDGAARLADGFDAGEELVDF